eukprot:6054445-Prymnesium_polylepis.1
MHMGKVTTTRIHRRPYTEHECCGSSSCPIASPENHQAGSARAPAASIFGKRVARAAEPAPLGILDHRAED